MSEWPKMCAIHGAHEGICYPCEDVVPPVPENQPAPKATLVPAKVAEDEILAQQAGGEAVA